LIAIAELMPLKILMREKITQTSSANGEHKRSKIERFSTLNEELLCQAQKSPSLSKIVNIQ